MKPSKPLEKFVHSHVAGLCICMNLSHFNIKLNFCELEGADMEIEIDYRYLDANINIDTEIAVKMWRRGEHDQIVASLAHELSHIITFEMADPYSWKGGEVKKASKEKEHYEERVTETVSRLALRLYKLENGL